MAGAMKNAESAGELLELVHVSQSDIIGTTNIHSQVGKLHAKRVLVCL